MYTYIYIYIYTCISEAYTWSLKLDICETSSALYDNFDCGSEKPVHTNIHSHTYPKLDFVISGTSRSEIDDLR